MIKIEYIIVCFNYVVNKLKYHLIKLKQMFVTKIIIKQNLELPESEHIKTMKISNCDDYNITIKSDTNTNANGQFEFYYVFGKNGYNFSSQLGVIVELNNGQIYKKPIELNPDTYKLNNTFIFTLYDDGEYGRDCYFKEAN